MALLFAGLFLCNFSWAASDDGSSCRSKADLGEVAWVNFAVGSSCPATASFFTGNDHCAVVASSDGFDCLPNQSGGITGGPYLFNGCLASDPENCGGDEEPEPNPELPDPRSINQSKVYSFSSTADGGPTTSSVSNAFSLQQARSEASLSALEYAMMNYFGSVNSNLNQTKATAESNGQLLAAQNNSMNSSFVDISNRFNSVSSQVGEVKLDTESIESKLDNLAQDLANSGSGFSSLENGIVGIHQHIGQLQSNLGNMDGAIARIEMNAASRFDVSQSEGNISSQMGEQFGQIMGGIYSNWTPTIQKVDDSYAALSEQIGNISGGSDPALTEKVDNLVTASNANTDKLGDISDQLTAIAGVNDQMTDALDGIRNTLDDGILKTSDAETQAEIRNLITKVDELKTEIHTNPQLHAMQENTSELLAEVKDMNQSQKDNFVTIIEKLVPPKDYTDPLNQTNQTLADIKAALTPDPDNPSTGDGKDIDASEEIQAIRDSIDNCFTNYILTYNETTYPQDPNRPRCSFAESIQRNLMTVNSTIAGQNDLLDRVANSNDVQSVMLSEVVRAVEGLQGEDDEVVAQLEAVVRNGGDQTALLDAIKTAVEEMGGGSGPVLGEVSLTPEAQTSLDGIGTNTAATNAKLDGIGESLSDMSDSLSEFTEAGSGQATGPETCTGPDCWKSKSWVQTGYPDGVQSVWQDRKDAFDNSSMNTYLQGLVPDMGVGGTLEPLGLCFDLGFHNFGCEEITVAPYVIAFIRLVVLISAGFFAQRLVFGGA